MNNKNYPTLKVGDRVKCGSLHVAMRIAHAIQDDGFKTKVYKSADSCYVEVIAKRSGSKSFNTMEVSSHEDE